MAHLGYHTIGITAVYEHAVSEMGTITVNVVNGIFANGLPARPRPWHG